MDELLKAFEAAIRRIVKEELNARIDDEVVRVLQESEATEVIKQVFADYGFSDELHEAMKDLSVESSVVIRKHW